MTPEQIERFALPAEDYDAERSRANAHMLSCPECRAAFEQTLRPFPLERMFGAESNGEALCLDDRLVKRYAAGKADAVERDLVEMHTEGCAACRAKVAQTVTASLPAAEQNTKEREDKERAARVGGEKPNTPTRPALFPRMPLPAWPDVARFRPLFTFGGAALAGAAVMLLLFHITPPRDTNSEARAAKLETALQLARTQQQESLRQSQERQAALQTAQQTLEKQNTELSATRQALTDARKQAGLMAAKIAAQSSPSPTLSFKDSERLLTDSKGNLAMVTPVDASESRFLRAADFDLRHKEIAALEKKGGTVLGSPGEESVSLLRPSQTYVGSLRPAFAWKAVPGVAAYRLSCIPQDAGEKRVYEFAAALTVPFGPALDSQAIVAWTIPLQKTALQADALYTWTVEAFDAQANSMARSSRHEELLFRTLKTAQVEEVARKSRQYADNPLLMGAVYARLGVLDEADQALARYLTANPASKEARRLQAQVKRQRTANP